MIKRYWIFLSFLFLFGGTAFGQTLVHYWNFNNSGSETTLLGASSTKGGGALALVKGATSVIPLTGNTTGQGFETNNENARNTDEAGSHLRFNNPLGGTLTFSLPTTGYENVVVKFTSRRSGQGAEFHIVDYTTDGTNYVSPRKITGNPDVPVLQAFDFSDVPAADNNANFKIRITFEQGSAGVEGNNRFDNFTLDGYSLDGDTEEPEPVDVKIAFDKKFVAIGEGDGTVAIKINITNPAAGDASLELKTGVFSTASAEDFTFTKQTLTFTAESDASQTINIPIINDNTQEQDEYFVLRLESIDGVAIDGSPYITVFIKDNDRTAPQPTHAIELEHVSSFAPGSSTAEIVVHDPTTQRLFIISSIQDRLDIANFSNPANITLVKSVDMAPYGGITSVAVKEGIVAVASPAADAMANGSVVFFNTDGVFQKQVTVGVLPDNLSFTPDGKKVLTANEGQPNDDYSVDPEGSVSIIDISGGIAGLDQSKVTTLLFTSFNSQEAALLGAGVRKLKKISTLSRDFEPEYITTAADSKKAWVTIQENNAIGEIDLDAKTIMAVWPLGKKDMSAFGNGFDASDNSGVVTLANWPVKAFYIPDGIANYTVGGTQYLVTANEGDEKEYGGLTERTTVGAVKLDATAFPHAAILQQDHAIGRLRITNLSGDTDDDGDYDELNVNGSRSFTIWNATTKTKVYDSGDDFERYTASQASGVSTIFNADNEDNKLKGRSRAKGPEPEGLTVASINNKFYAFITLERVGGVMVYDITDPAKVKFVDYKNSRNIAAFGGDHGPEGIIYIAPDQSPDGKAYVALANEISGSVSVFEVTPTPVIAANEDAADTQALRLHPNPATDRVLLPLPDAGTKTVVLYQSNGMLQEAYTTTEQEIELNVGSFSKGYYLVRVTTPKRVYYSKLVKQ